MFARVAGGRSRGQQVTDATKVGQTIMLILAVVALIETRRLHLFGVSLDAFMVAGGAVLAWMGLTLLRALAIG
jgi:multiple antibiotic resistance protein